MCFLQMLKQTFLSRRVGRRVEQVNYSPQVLYERDVMGLQTEYFVPDFSLFAASCFLAAICDSFRDCDEKDG